MSLLDDITVLILTYNEECNIKRTLGALKDFPHVVVLDSHSTDSTPAFVAGFSNATLHTRKFDQHALQWNFGLHECGILTEWVLALDADYVVSRALVDEIAALVPAPSLSGYRVAFDYCVYGRRLLSALYPAHVVLFRRSRGRYEQHGHTQRLVLEGGVVSLRARIDHDDRKPLERWFASQRRYAALEAEYLLSKPRDSLSRNDRVRLGGLLGPALVFLYTLLWMRCIFDGWPGWFYVLQRTLAEIMIALEIISRRLCRCAEEKEG